MILAIRLSIWLTGLWLAIYLLAGCGGPSAADRLAERQRAIQDCILAGGHARLGPGQTILCDP